MSIFTRKFNIGKRVRTLGWIGFGVIMTIALLVTFAFYIRISGFRDVSSDGSKWEEAYLRAYFRAPSSHVVSRRLKGKVRTLVENTYHYQLSWYKSKRGPIYRSDKMVFDSSGMMTQRFESYIEAGGSKRTSAESRWENNYDSRGKIIDHVRLLHKFNRGHSAPGERTKFEYATNGQLLMQKYYSSKGKLKSYHRYEYSSLGILERNEMYHSGTEEPTSETKFMWFSNGRLAEAVKTTKASTNKLVINKLDNEGYRLLFDYEYSSKDGFSASKAVVVADKNLNFLSIDQQEFRDESGSLSSAREGMYEYQFDSTGNWIKRTFLGTTTYFEDDGGIKWINQEEIEREIEYFE